MSFQDRTGIPKINRDQLALTTIFVPELMEQHAISRILSACDDKAIALEREITLLDELFRAVLEALMTGRLSAQSLVEAEGTV